MVASGICHSDEAIRRGDASLGYLVILGHEGAGIVEKVGSKVKNFKPGDTIAVFGTGAVGLAAMVAGKIYGCIKVIAVDIVSERLELAKELGATHAINSKEKDPVEKIKELTGGYGVDWIVDTTGISSVIMNSVAALAQGWTCTAIAVTPHLIELSTWNDLCVDDKKIVGVNMDDSIPQIDIPRLIEFYKLGWFDFDKTIKSVLIIAKDYRP